MENREQTTKPKSWASVAKRSSGTTTKTPLTSKVTIPDFPELVRLTDQLQKASVTDPNIRGTLPSSAPENLTAKSQEAQFPALGSTVGIWSQKTKHHATSETRTGSNRNNATNQSRGPPKKKDCNCSSLAGSTLEQREQALAVREQQIAYREQQVAHKENILNSLLEKLEYTINLAMQDKEELLIKHLPDPSTATQVPQPWNTSDGLSEYLGFNCTSTSEDAASESSDQVASLTSSIQQLQSVQAETATQLWYEPYGTDIELLAKDAYGNLVSLPLHRSIVEPRSGWVREHISLALHNRCNLGADDDEGATQKKAILLELDMESSVATACFFFAYTRGKSIHTEMNSQSPGEELLKSCSPNLAHNFNLSPIHRCIHMYDAALKLRMPELCCYLLEQMEILATNVAESACVQRVRGPRFSIREVKNALEGAMAFLYTAEKQVQWRPMQVAFAALYDAVALRVGPSLYPTHSEEMKNLVRKLHEDHIEYRQLQRSCLPRPGSLVPSSHEMGRLLARAEDPSYLWHGCDLHHDLYSDGGIHRLRNQSSTYRAQNRDRKKGPPRSGSMLSDVSVDIQL